MKRYLLRILYGCIILFVARLVKIIDDLLVLSDTTGVIYSPKDIAWDAFDSLIEMLVIQLIGLGIYLRYKKVK